jgi:hypothetical protein
VIVNEMVVKEVPELRFVGAGGEHHGFSDRRAVDGVWIIVKGRDGGVWVLGGIINTARHATGYQTPGDVAWLQMTETLKVWNLLMDAMDHSPYNNYRQSADTLTFLTYPTRATKTTEARRISCPESFSHWSIRPLLHDCSHDKPLVSFVEPGIDRQCAVSSSTLRSAVSGSINDINSGRHRKTNVRDGEKVIKEANDCWKEEEEQAMHHGKGARVERSWIDAVKEFSPARNSSGAEIAAWWDVLKE